jgi:hypothetical protein
VEVAFYIIAMEKWRKEWRLEIVATKKCVRGAFPMHNSAL